LLTSCNKDEQVEKPIPVPKIESEAELEPELDPEVNPQIEEAKDYIIQEGLKPVEVINEGIDKVITWEDLCIDTNIQSLNAFLDDEVANISEHDSYGPVNLKSIILLLEDKKTVAEIYFQDEKILGGVTYSKDEVSRTNRQYRSLSGKTLEQINDMDYPVWKAEQVNQPTLYLAQTANAFEDGFNEISHVISFDSGRSLIVFRNDTESRVYVYDTQNGTDFYTGISLQENSSIKVTELEDNKTALMLSDKIIILDSSSFKLLEEIKYPEGEILQPDDMDISSDGRTIAYTTQKGLLVSDINFENKMIIVESKIGKDPNGMDWEVPRYPVFSPDSTQILYRIVGYEWSVGTGVIKVDGSDNRFFECDAEERVFTEWYDYNLLYSNNIAYSETNHPMLLNIDTGEKIDLIKDVPKDKFTNYYPDKKGKLFYWETKLPTGETDDKNSLLVFGSYDVHTHSSEKVLEIPMINMESGVYDSLDSNFIFTASKYPVRTKLFILAGID